MSRWGIFVLLLFAWSAAAHEVRPAFFEIIQRDPTTCDVVWKVPMAGGMAVAGEELAHAQEASAGTTSAPTLTMPCGCPAPTREQLSRGLLAIHPSLPPGSRMKGLARIEHVQGAEIRSYSMTLGPQGLEGWVVAVHGLEATMIDALVRIQLADGRVVSRLLRPAEPSFVYTSDTAGPAASGYLILGIEHILLGVDHLLFVLALLLIVRRVSLLVKTITAFTAAHSITLALSVLGIVRVPVLPVEVAIAISIIFVAAEILRLRRGESALTARAPWVVAFVFGQLHGFGFAGALSEVGLPANDIPLALLYFNIGVEIGQLSFIAVALLVISLIRRVRLPLPTWADLIPPYAIGSLAMFWAIERFSRM